jgi:ketosteroid isomerase-like protein
LPLPLLLLLFGSGVPVLVLGLQAAASAKEPSNAKRGASDLLMQPKLHTDLGSVPGRDVFQSDFFCSLQTFRRSGEPEAAKAGPFPKATGPPKSNFFQHSGRFASDRMAPRLQRIGSTENIAMTTNDTTTKNEAAIRQLIDRLVAAIRAKDIDSVMASYATDLVAFDIIEPLQFVGIRAYKKPWQDVFERFQTLDYEVRDLRISAGDDVAFSHSLNRIQGVMTNGQNTALWLRFTAGYRKVGGKWLIAHVQASVPSDLASGEAKLDLEPDSVAVVR